MASLTETAIWAKKIIKYGAIGILAFLILKLTFSVVKDLWLRFHPAPPPPPTVAFGKLPVIKFSPESTVTLPDQPVFKLETPTGSFPATNSQAKVYKVPPQRPTLLTLDKAKEDAAKLGFIEEPKTISQNLFQWTALNCQLQMDIYTGFFEFSCSNRTDDSLKAKNVPSKDQAIAQAKEFLKKINKLTDDLDKGRIETAYLKWQANAMIPVSSLSEADLVKVEIFRKNIDEVSCITADPQKGLVSFIIGSAAGSIQGVIKAEFNYYPVAYETFATYPLKTANQAWDELKQGRASVTAWGAEGSEIVVRRINLAYFDSFASQEYLQPVFVFLGDDGFMALLPALTGEWQAAANGN